MTTLFVLVVVVLGAAAGYVPLLRTIELRRRYGPVERRFIRAADAQLERDPGDLRAALALLDLYRANGDHVRLRALYLHTRAHLEGRPEYEPLRRAQLVGPWVGPQLLPRPEIVGGQTFTYEREQATGKLRMAGLSVQGIAEIVQLELAVAGLGLDRANRSDAVPPELRVLSLEAVVSEDRVNALLARAGAGMPPGLSDVRVTLSEGEITLAGAFFHVPFRMGFRVRPASDRAVLFHLPRAVQFLGIPTIPATVLAEKIMTSIRDRHPQLITVLDATTFILDLVATSPVPVQLNLASITVAAGELVIQAREGQAAPLDLGPWRGAASAPAPAVAALPPAPEPAVSANTAPVPASPEEYRRALAAGELGAALAMGVKVLEARPLDLVLREELVALAMRTGETRRALDLALERLADLPGGPPHPSARLRLMAGQALAGLARRDEAEVQLEGLEAELTGRVGDEYVAADLATLATLRVRLLGDLVRGAHALERVADVAGPQRAPGAFGADPMADPLRQAVQVAWEAGRADVCARLAQRLVHAVPFESTAWRLLGLALRRREQPLRAYTALAAAAWLNPLDRTAVEESGTLRRQLEPELDAPRAGALVGASLLHAAEAQGAGAALRVLVPHLGELVAAESSALPETLAPATDATHQVLLETVRAAAAGLGQPVPEVLLVPDPAPVVEAADAPRPVLRVHTGALAELSREELAFAVARAVWQAGRGDARWRRLTRAQQRVVAAMLATLRAETPWRERAEHWAVEAPGRLVAGTLIGRWAREAWEETWPQEAALARLLSEDKRAEAQRLARELPRRPLTADVETWCAALDLTADRAALALTRDLAAALGALFKAELRSRTLLAQVRERGVPWALQTLTPVAFSRRVRELLLYAVQEI